MVIIKREKEEQNKSQIGKVPKDDKKLINKKPKGGKKKGMSVDEKAKVIIDIYYKKVKSFNLSLENCTKFKGNWKIRIKSWSW